MIKINEVSQEVKNRVVALFDQDALAGVLDPHTLRVIVTGLSLQTLNKKYGGTLGNGIEKDATDVLSNEQALELVADRRDNVREYVQLARDIYVEATISDAVKILGPGAEKAVADIFGATSAPDATGNDLDIEAAADNVCPICNEVHER